MSLLKTFFNIINGCNNCNHFYCKFKKMNKLSIYNKIVKNIDKYIYFNTFKGIFVGLNEKEHKVVEKEFENLEGFKEKFPNIFKKFSDSGFIIDKERDELKEVLFNKKREVFLNREYLLFLHPTLDCNFNCWYCYEEHPKDIMSKNLIKKVKRHIKYMSDKITAFHLSWFGGEPLMYFNEIVEPLSIYTQNICKKNKIPFINSITTNAYYIDKKMVDSFKEIKLNSFQITIDGNKEKHNKVRQHYGEPTFDKIIENIILLCNEIEDVSITLRINYDNKTLDYEPDFLTIFPMEIRDKINIDFQRVWQTCSNSEENINFNILRWKQFVHNEGFKVMFSSLYPNNHVTCYVDRYFHTEIDHKGKVYKCTARGYTKDYEVGKLLDNGIIEYYKKDEAIAFHKLPTENDICLNCIYLPMCGGPCTQKNKENLKFEDICLLNNQEIPMEEAIKINYENFKKNFQTNSNKK